MLRMGIAQKAHTMAFDEGGFLADARKMKEEVRENLEQKEYDVADFYHETGIWQTLAKSQKFDNLTLGVITFNAIWIGVDADHNTKPAGETDIQFVIADQFFCIYFTFELLTRFMAFAKKCNCLKDGWFKFDTAIVTLMVVETWVTPWLGLEGGGTGDASILRLLRLLRLTRMARLMRSVPELLTLVKGMAAAVRSVSSVLILLIIFTYIFAIIFKQQTKGDSELEDLFGTIPEAMWNLIMAGTLCDNLTTVLNLLRERNEVMCAFFLLWVLVSSLTMLNMLIGVLCEVVSAVSEAEKEKNAVNFAKSQFLSVLEEFDRDSSGSLNETEFEAFVMHKDLKAPLDFLEVDRENLRGLTDVFYHAQDLEELDNEATLGSTTANDFFRPMAMRTSVKRSETKERTLKFGELLEKILDLRASNPAMVSHIVQLRKYLGQNQKEMKDIIVHTDSEMTDVKEQQTKLQLQQRQLTKRQDEMMEMIRAIHAKLGCSSPTQDGRPASSSPGFPDGPSESQSSGLNKLNSLKMSPQNEQSELPPSGSTTVLPVLPVSPPDGSAEHLPGLIANYDGCGGLPGL